MQTSTAICAIADYIRSATLRQPPDEDARAELSALTATWDNLRARIVSSREEYDSSQHFDALLTDAEGTYTVSFAPADGLPWPLRAIHRWSEGDLVRVNGTTLRIQQAVACLDFVWERDDLLEHLINVCLVEEELATREPFPVGDSDLQARLDAFRRARGLFAAADTHEWLAHHGISQRQLERRLADELRVELLAEQTVGNAVADYLKAHKSEFGIFPAMLASAPSQEDLQDLDPTMDPASWLTWAVTPGAHSREVRCQRIGAFDAPPPLAALASDDIPVGTVSEIFLHGNAHTIACKIGPTEPSEPGPELTTRVRDHLFANWLAERRRHADVEWYWGGPKRSTESP
jgi:putative peptide maturation system protein